MNLCQCPNGGPFSRVSLRNIWYSGHRLSCGAILKLPHWGSICPGHREPPAGRTLSTRSLPLQIGPSKRLRQYVNRTLSETTHIHAVSRPGYFHLSRRRACLTSALYKTQENYRFFSMRTKHADFWKVMNNWIYILCLWNTLYSQFWNALS